MKIYHGSQYTDIEQFEFGHSRTKLDFGEGIYFTTNIDQAKEKSCKNKLGSGAVYECEVDLSQFRILRFESPTDEDLTYTLYLCRINLEDVAKDTIPGFGESDLIWGSMLDGKIKQFEELAELFNAGDRSYEQFISQIDLFGSTCDQLCIKTDYALALVNKGLVQKYLTQKDGEGISITKQLDMKER